MNEIETPKTPEPMSIFLAIKWSSALYFFGWWNWSRWVARAYADCASLMAAIGFCWNSKQLVEGILWQKSLVFLPSNIRKILQTLSMPVNKRTVNKPSFGSSGPALYSENRWYTMFLLFYPLFPGRRPKLSLLWKSSWFAISLSRNRAPGIHFVTFGV